MLKIKKISEFRMYNAEYRIYIYPKIQNTEYKNQNTE